MTFVSPHWMDQLYRTQYQLTTVSYIKCPITWQDHDFTPDFNRFYFIIDGEGMLEVDGVKYDPKPYQLFLLPAGRLQSYGTISENTFEKYWCHFRATIGGINLFQLLHTPVYIDVVDKEQLTQTFKSMITLYNSKDYYSMFKLQSMLLELISYFIEHADQEQVYLNVSSSMEKINSLLTYIEGRLSTSFTIEQLAEISHYHPNHLLRVFKQFTGCSPIQYINQRRIATAKHLLISSDESIAQISESLGMEPHYFSRMFKEETGYSPSLFRKMKI